MNPKVSIIIVNLNGANYLYDCLSSLKSIDYQNYEVILVDNASSDSSLPLVKQNFPWVKIIALKENHGFAEASNIGADHASGDLLVFLNNDTRVKKTWLSEMVKHMDDSIATCGSKILFYEKDIINHAGGAITLLGSGYDIGFGKRDSKEFDDTKFVGSTCGCSMLIRKNIFELLGGFDPDYFACSEDVDLCLRAWIYGFKNLYVPSSVVYHRYGGTLGKRQSYKRVYFCQRNRLINILKNFEPQNILKGILISIIYDFVRILFFVCKKDIKLIFYLIKAYIDVLMMTKPILKKRRVIQKNRRVSDNKLVKMGVITSLTKGIHEFIRLNINLYGNHGL